MTNANIVLPNTILCLARFLSKLQFISYLFLKGRQGCAYIYILHHVSIITIYKRFENRTSYFPADSFNFIIIYNFIPLSLLLNPPEVLESQPFLPFHDSGQNEKWDYIKSIGRQAEYKQEAQQNKQTNIISLHRRFLQCFIKYTNHVRIPYPSSHRCHYYHTKVLLIFLRWVELMIYKQKL